ncbi:MAG: hypothetical protein IT174_03445 [Acidobacteria bacterium]|nr:hypothetical protein [Acidobacteriota bacterium]
MHPSVIVIHDTNDRYDYESVLQWFAGSSLQTYEAADLFDAIDKMSDFTATGCPDVLLVRIRPGSQQDRMICEFETGVAGNEVPIAVVSDGHGKNEKKRFNFGSIGRLKANLDRPARRSRATFS